jgi:RHS repeat-associated protein
MAHQQALRHEGARGRLVRNFAQWSAGLVLRWVALILLASGIQIAYASPNFSNLQLTPTSGSVDAGKTMPVSFGYDVVWDREGDCGFTVKRVEVIANGDTLSPDKGYKPTDCPSGDPEMLDELRKGPITVNLGVGTHVLMLRAYANGLTASGYSEQRTIIITSKDDAQRVGESVPTEMVAGQQYDVSVTLKNTGVNTWATATHNLGAQPDDMTWGLNRVTLNASVAPGATKTINFKVTAPATPGSYPFQWRMLRDSTWFGEASTKVMVNVIPPKPTLKVTRDPNPMLAGEPFQLTWVSTNATKVEYECTSSNGGYVGKGEKSKVSDTETLVADPNWVDRPSECKWTATGPNGTATVDETMTTIDVTFESAFVDLRAPSSVNAGRNYAASVTMKNTGTGTWRAGSNFQLGSQNPADNQTWGLSRVDVDADVKPGDSKTFTFSITAPTTLGNANFQWQMVRKKVDGSSTWFGTKSANKVVKVLAQDAPIPVDITPPHLSNPDAGSLPGELSVDHGGAATYSIPIEVPPGTAGLKPNLSISYSSQSGNGPLGLGWSLGGLSSIHRCGKTIAQDGINDRIRFATSDRLCLDGQRLVLANKPLTDENYWSDKAEYRTEIDQLSRITAFGTGKNLRFKVETRDKRTLWYGGNAAGAGTSGNVKAVVGTINAGTLNEFTPEPKPGALAWAVDRITDRAGNYIAFSYEQDAATGEHKPVTIRYGGVGLKSHAAVQLTWEARQDAWKRYVDEARNDLRSRIAGIKTYYGSNLDGDVAASGTLVRDYAFTYEQSTTSGRSMLTTAKVCALNPQSAAMDCLPETTFEWGKALSEQPGWVDLGYWDGAPDMETINKVGDANVSALHRDYFAFADFENHGRTDVLEKRVSTPLPAGEITYDIRYADANHLGFNVYKNEYRYFSNLGASFKEYKYRISTGEEFVVLSTGDFNGDGAPDLVAHAKGGVAKICLSPLAYKGPQGPTIVFDCNNNLKAFGGNRTYEIPHVVDVLGEGRSAIYSRFDEQVGYAKLAIQSELINDPNAPVNYLGYSQAVCCNPLTPLAQYVDFNEMFDFAGTGKQQDVRWTKPHYQKQWCDDGGGSCFGVNAWQNKQPKIVMTGFRKPETTDRADTAAPYLYEKYNPRGCVEGDCSGVNRPPYDFHVAEPSTGDFNGTGYSSPVFGFVEFKYPDPDNLPNYSRAELTTCVSTGRRLDCGIRKKYSGDAYMAPSAVGNYVGDGAPGFFAVPRKLVNGNPETGEIHMCRIFGDDTTGGTGTDDKNIKCEAWEGPKLEFGQTVFDLDMFGTGRPQRVVYQRGHYEGNTWMKDGRWRVYEARDRATYPRALDRIHKVTNGVGAVSEVEYGDAVADGYVTKSGNSTLSYPQHPTASVGKIVRKLVHSNGVARERSFKYSYEDAGIDVAGRGSLGFAKVIQKDEQKNITTTTTYSQQWPFVGMVLSQKTELWGNEKPLSETTNRLLQKTIIQSNQQKTYCPLSAGSKVVRYDDKHYLGTMTTTGVDTDDVQYDNRCNLLNSKTVSEGSAVDESATFTTKTVNTYYAADFEHWLVDLVEYARVTNEQSGDPRKITWYRDVWYEANFSGHVSMEKIQNWGDDPSQTLTVEYKRDGNPFGLVSSKIESWLDPLNSEYRARTSKTVYDANGRLPVTLTNPEKHAETKAYNFGSGAPISHLDANQLETKWTVDGFGRVLTEKRPGGNETRSYVKQCKGDCPTKAVVAKIVDHFNGSDRIAVPQVSYQDSSGHVLQSLTWGFDGRQIQVDLRYDLIGRLYETDHPRFSGDTAYLASRQEYDDLDRLKVVTTKDEEGNAQTLTNDYQGMVTVITNPKLQKRTEKRDVLGQVRQVIDNKSGVTKFGYDACGNLSQTIDPNGNVISVTFDDLGRRKKLDDPDLGVITYTPDAAGRVRKQVSPNDRALNKSTTTDYDMLDRMTVRIERSLESRWVYDKAPVKGIGKLNEAYTVDGNGAKDYRRTHTYDALGRPSTTTQSLDRDYISTSAYDTWGRPSKQTHQRGTDAAKEYFLRYNEYGYQSAVERPGLVLSQALRQDAANRVTLSQLGNGLTDSVTYSPHTGRMVGGMVKTAANAVRLHEGYLYDELGNVEQRTQYWDTAGFVEEFNYDELNRLWTSTVDGKPQKTFNYDAAGNITNKTGLGWYTYPTQGAGAVRPHAVKSITNVPGTFEYDDNGNLLRGADREISWTSFDMPRKISEGTRSSTFAYGPEHQRTKQTRGDGSTIIYAGAQEVETKAGVTKVKTYWPGGIGLEIDYPDSDQGTKLHWTHADRLGSPVAITDTSGNFDEKLEYDAWGKRRNTKDHDTTPDSLDGVVDNKGFTNHEMLDQLDLVHMNGRVYDPLTGRFLSGDPIIQDPKDGQNYNRYSYVVNNPTNLTDPTGFASESTTPRIDAGIRSRAQRKVDEAAANLNAMDPDDLQEALGDKVYNKVIETGLVKGKNGVNQANGKGSAAAPAAASGSGDGPGLRVPNLQNAQSTIAWGRTHGEIEEARGASKAFALGFFPGSGAVEGAEKIKGAHDTGDVLLGIGMLLTELPGLKQVKGAAKGGNFVYRGLAKGEDAAAGLSARAPGAGNSPISHVAGKKETQWISTTKDMETALAKYGQNGVVRIDLNKVKSEVLDVSGGFPKGGRMSNWSRRDQEVLIRDFIPPEAIERIK